MIWKQFRKVLSGAFTGKLRTTSLPFRVSLQLTWQSKLQMRVTVAGQKLLEVGRWTFRLA